MIEQKRNMKGTLKSFDRNEHNIYDKKGKESFLNFLNHKFKKFNLVTIENSNAYGIDLLTLNEFNKAIHCWEIEVRYGNWKGDVKFPFDKINCIERKDYQWRKEDEFVQKIPHPLNNNYKVTYVQLNNLCNRAVMIDSDVILNFPLVPWSNRKSTGEYVRQVPITHTVQVEMKL